MWIARLGFFFLFLVGSMSAIAQEVDVLHEDEDGRYGWAYNDFKSFHTFTFNYTPMGDDFRESVILTFDSFLRRGSRNGYKVIANRRTVSILPEFNGTGQLKPLSASLTGRLVAGENTIRIESTATSPNQNADWGLTNIKVERTSTPLTRPDLTVETVNKRIQNQANQTFELEAQVANTGLRQSTATTLTFYMSDDKTITEQDESIGNTNVASIGAGNTESFSIEVNRASITPDSYLGACIETVSLETNTDNNCSEAVSFSSTTLPASIVPLLLD